MNWLFFFKCFLIGISAATTMGPIFVLTFNNGAIHGFFKGFLTALSAAIGDGILLLLGLMGTLNILANSPSYHLTIDLVGGALLIMFGILMFFTQKTNQPSPSTLKITSEGIFFIMSKSFLSTILNPLTILFFMFISAQLLPPGSKNITLNYLLIGGSCAGLGTLCGLSSVAYIASRIGNVIKRKRLKYISFITGSIILCIGAYFFIDAIGVILKMSS